MNIGTAVDVISNQFPQLCPVTARYLGEGYDSIAFDVAPNWVFRFPNRADVEAQLLCEIRVLPRFVNDAPLAIPEYEFVGVPSALFPRHFGGYRKLQGEPALGIDAMQYADSIAPALGSFLTWLHSRNVVDAAALGVPPIDVCALMSELGEETSTDLLAVQDLENVDTLAGWRAYFASTPPGPRDERRSVLLHGDLAAEHVLWAPQEARVLGVIDWSEIAMGDPAIDLAALYHWGGPRFALCALAHYRAPVDTATLDRARYVAACRGLADIVFGMETGRDEYIEAGRRALHMNIERQD